MNRANNKENNLTMVSGAGGKEKVTVTKQCLEDMKARAAKASKLEKEVTATKKAAEKATKDLEVLKTEYSKVGATMEKLQQKTKEQLEELAKNHAAEIAKRESEWKLALEQAKASTSTPPSALSSKSSGSAKVKKSELNQELVNHVTNVSKTVLFRTTKFIEDELEEKEVTEEILPHLPVPIKMPKEEFIAKYSNVVYEGIKAGRTDVQSSGKKRAQGTRVLCNC